MTETTETLGAVEIAEITEVADLGERFQYHYRLVDKFARQTLAQARQAGLCLVRGKELLPHGEFRPWAASLGLTPSTTTRLLRLGQNDQVEHFAPGTAVSQALLAIASPERDWVDDASDVLNRVGQFMLKAEAKMMDGYAVDMRPLLDSLGAMLTEIEVETRKDGNALNRLYPALNRLQVGMSILYQRAERVIAKASDAELRAAFAPPARCGGHGP